MPWITAAEGNNLSDLQATIADRDLKPGTRVKMVMEFNVPGAAKALDMWGAENLFRSQIPPEMRLIDVYEEGGKGIVEMEAEGAWFLPLLAFVKAHWLWIIVAGVALYLLIKFVRMIIQVSEIIGPEWTKLLIIGGVALIAYYVLKPRVAKLLPAKGKGEG